MPSSLAFASISVSIPTKFIVLSLVLLSSFFWNDLVVTFMKMVKSFGGCQQLFFFSHPYVLVSIVVKGGEVLKQVIDTVKMGAAGEGLGAVRPSPKGFYTIQIWIHSWHRNHRAAGTCGGSCSAMTREVVFFVHRAWTL